MTDQTGYDYWLFCVVYLLEVIISIFHSGHIVLLGHTRLFVENQLPHIVVMGRTHCVRFKQRISYLTL